MKDEIVMGTHARRLSIDQQIGLRIIEARSCLGISCADLALAIDVPETALAAMESGEQRASVDDLHAITNAVKRPIRYFYEGLQEGPKFALTKPALTTRKLN
jgi:transcriptional regulator with XRE-family HTH domain